MRKKLRIVGLLGFRVLRTGFISKSSPLVVMRYKWTPSEKQPRIIYTRCSGLETRRIEEQEIHEDWVDGSLRRPSVVRRSGPETEPVAQNHQQTRLETRVFQEKSRARLWFRQLKLRQGQVFNLTALDDGKKLIFFLFFFLNFFLNQRNKWALLHFKFSPSYISRFFPALNQCA